MEKFWERQFSQKPNFAKSNVYTLILCRVHVKLLQKSMQKRPIFLRGNKNLEKVKEKKFCYTSNQNFVKNGEHKFLFQCHADFRFYCIEENSHFRADLQRMNSHVYARGKKPQTACDSPFNHQDKPGVTVPLTCERWTERDRTVILIQQLMCKSVIGAMLYIYLHTLLHLYLLRELQSIKYHTYMCTSINIKII